MPSARQRRALMHSRNAGLQRLRSLTKRVGVAAAVLTGIFAGLAAAGNSGKHRRTATQPRTPTATKRVSTTTARAPAPPSLPPVGDDGGSSASPPPSPSPAQSAPQQAQAPPVAVSGGS